VKTTWFSDNAEWILGYTAEEMDQPHWWHAHLVDEQVKSLESVREWASPDHSQLRQEYQFMRRDGNPMWVQEDIRILWDANGEPREAISAWTDVTERKQAEAALRASEERYRFISSVASDYMFFSRVLPDGRLEQEWTAGALEEITGCSVDEYLASGGWKARVHPEDRALDAEDMRRLHANQAVDREIRILHRDGSVRWVHVLAQPVWDDEQDRLAGIYGAVRDINEHKQAELALAASEERYRIISSVASDYMFYSHIQPDGSLGLDWAAGAFAEMTGYSFDDYIAAGGWRAHVHPDDLAQDDLDLQALRENREVETEIRTLRRDGSTLWVQVSARPVLDDISGELVGIYGAVRNITNRKQALAALQESESKFRALFQNRHTVMFLVDPQTSAIIEANPAAVAYYGYDVETLCRMKVSDINTLARAGIMDEMRAAQSEERTFFQSEHRLASGEVRDVEVFTGPIELEGRPLLYSIIHDVTARRQAEDAVQQKMEDLMRFQRLTVGRELKMIELKKEINQLLAQIGQPPRYREE
jgi:PAS domain S-box-containing protein